MPGLTLRTLRRLEKMLRDYESGRLTNPPRRPAPHRARPAGPRVVMLLEDCASGDRAEAAVLVEIASTETQIVEFCGTPTSGTFKLDFAGETTAALTYNATAAEMQAALESLSNLNPGDVAVEIGPSAGVGGHQVFRWLVHFRGRLAGVDVSQLIPREVDVVISGFLASEFEPLKVRSLPDLEDTGETLEGLCVTPLPAGVVIPAGSVAVCLFVPTFGYCFITAECGECEIDESY